LRYIINNKLII